MQLEILDFQAYNQSLRRTVFKKHKGLCDWCGRKLIFKLTSFRLLFVHPFLHIDREYYNQRSAKWAKGHYRRYQRGEIHHLVPKYKGGTNHPENLTLLCPVCHRYIHAWNYFLDSIHLTNESQVIE